jgi:hypothetical protein
MVRWTTVLRRQAGEAATKKRRKSLALSVYFKQPDFGMKDYEILSRATAYLLGVDPPAPSVPQGPYSHLEVSGQLRSTKKFQREKNYTPASGSDRNIMDLSWLEFAPREVRPNVHVVCSSHVVAPFLWKDYYPQGWLNHVRPEHCAYAVEVYDATVADSSRVGDSPAKPLAKIALDSHPFHHPEGRDLALLHLKEEASSLQVLASLGVDVLHLRSPDKLYQKGETMMFDGFVVSEQNSADGDLQPERSDSNEDLRVFYPYEQSGTLSFHTEDRFFASTKEPLPEGLCGAPVLDADGDLCGTVEGIVPVTHKNKLLAGSAAFMPSHVMKQFIDFVERGLLEQMMPPDLFQMVVTAKKTNSIGGGVFKPDGKGGHEDSNWEEAYDIALENLRKRYSPQEVEAILQTVERERDEVLEIMDKEGGDMDEIMERVRLKTLQMREMIRDQVLKGKNADPSHPNQEAST